MAGVESDATLAERMSAAHIKRLRVEVVSKSETAERPTEYYRRVYPAPGTDAAIRALAVRMARELDVSVGRAEEAVRNLIVQGLIERSAETHG